MISMFFKVVSCEERRIVKSMHRMLDAEGKPKIGEDGKAELHCEYESQGWVLHLEPGNISYRIHENSDGFKAGDIIKLSLQQVEESEVPTLVRKILGLGRVPLEP
jgi:hypothetical protein